MPRSGKDLRRWLRKLHDEIHVTSVFVTHDQEEALEVADRIVVMNRGRIEQEGTPTEVFQQPANAFVMDFLGNVNLFHGRVEGGKAVFGSLMLDYPEGSKANGRAARLLVRPHDLEIHTRPNGRPTLPARVSRILTAGPQVKIELLAAAASRSTWKWPTTVSTICTWKRAERCTLARATHGSSWKKRITASNQLRSDRETAYTPNFQISIPGVFHNEPAPHGFPCCLATIFEQRPRSCFSVAGLPRPAPQTDAPGLANPA